MSQQQDGTAAANGSGRELVYVGDPMCSWCWGFAPVIEEIEARYDVPVRTIVGGLRTGPAAQPMGPEVRTHFGRYWQHVADRTGQTFTNASLERGDWIYDTEPSCMAVVAMREIRPEDTLRWMVRIQRAFYVEGVDVTDLGAFPELAAEFDVDEASFAKTLWAEETRALTRADFEAARTLGVEGFPTLLLRDRSRLQVVTRGYAGLDDLHPVLTDLLADGQQPEAADGDPQADARTG